MKRVEHVMSVSELNPRRQVQLAMQGENLGRIPFVIWNNKIPDKTFEKRLLDSGACIIVKSEIYNAGLRTIHREDKSWVDEDGQKMLQTVYYTGYGIIEETKAIFTGTQFTVSHLFKSLRDYDAILSLINDVVYTPCYEKFLRDDGVYGERGLARPATEKTPFFSIIYEIMGVMNFAIEWQENRERVLEIYEALLAARRKRLDIVAESPAKYCIVDGNIEMSLVGRERFEKYYVPLIKEAADIMDSRGILTGLHLDGKNRMLISPVAGMQVNIIESFTPPPDCDISLKEALDVWPDKSFMVNFPSSLHLMGAQTVESYAVSILEQAKNTGRVMIGVMEDVPKNDYLPLLAKLITSY